jgi:hypothetical protein
MQRRQADILVSFAALLVCTGIALGQNTNQPAAAGKAPAANDKKAAEPAKAEKTPSLDELLASALNNNPDIRVAEAKLHEAEAVMNRSRLQVMQKVITFHNSVGAQKEVVKAAQATWERYLELNKQAVLSAEDFAQARQALEQAKSKLATLEAEMPALLGKLPQNIGQDKKQDRINANDAWINIYQQLVDPVAPSVYVAPSDVTNAWLGQTIQATNGQWYRPMTAPFVYDLNYSAWINQPANNGWIIAQGLNGAPAPAVTGTLPDKIRQALDKVVTIDVKDKGLSEALKIFEQQAAGVPFHTVLPPQTSDKHKITLHLEQIPLGAAFQALEDSFPEVLGDGLRLAVRDYGILVTTRPLLPKNATLLHDFWKKPPGKEPVKEQATGAGKNPPPASVEGTVTAVDEGSGLVTISIGTDAGLTKGDTLEIYRLKPEPVYLGTMRIEEAKTDKAVGKPNSPKRSLQAGDKVSKQIQGH